jgi:hypothetical protein
MAMFENDEAWRKFTDENRIYDFMSGKSNLATLLSSGQYNTEQTNEIIARIARDPSQTRLGAPLLGQDPQTEAWIDTPSPGQTPLPSVAPLQEDQRIIAQSVDRAFRDGAISVDDLRNVGNEIGAERVVSMLGRAEVTTGGAYEALALSMIDQPLESHRSSNEATTMAYSMLASEPFLLQEHVREGGTVKPQDAFEALVARNNETPYNPESPMVFREDQERGLAAAAAIYGAHGPALIDHYSGANGNSHDMADLAMFWSQTSVNPFARDLPVKTIDENGNETSRTIAETVNGTTNAHVDTLLGRLQSPNDAVDNPHYDNNDLVAQLASIQGGMDVARQAELTRYQSVLAGNEALQNAFGDVGEQLAGTIPTGKVPLLGDVVANGGRLIGTGVGGMFTGNAGDVPVYNPQQQPDLSQTIYARLGNAEDRIFEGMISRSDNLQDDFDAARNRRATDITTEYNNRRNENTYDVVPVARPSETSERADVSLGEPTTRVALGSQATLPAGIQQTALMSDTCHPQNARFSDCLTGTHRTNLALSDVEHSNLAGSLAVQSLKDGLPQVDTVLSSRSGDRVFAVYGAADNPAHQRTFVDRDNAVATPLVDSSRQMNALLAQGLATPSETPLERDQAIWGPTRA